MMKEMRQLNKDSKMFTENHIKTFKTEILTKVSEKEYESDNLIRELKESHESMTADQNDKTAEMVNSIKWRIEDCETRVSTRITADYVLDLVKQLERGMKDNF